MNTNIQKTAAVATATIAKKNNFPGLEELNTVIDNDMQSFKKGFPLDVFPEAIQELIHEAKKTVGFDKDYFSAGILSLCATATGNGTILHNGSYPSKPILWISIIGFKGDGKSHPLKFAKKPIKEKDDQTYMEYKNLIQEFEEIEHNNGKKPKYAKFILENFTPEKLAEALQFNEKGILIFGDELMRWINSFDQFKKGGDQQMYLELFNGYELTVDRVTKEPIRVEETNVNVLGGMQPEKIKRFAGNDRCEDGFLDRFLFVFPEKFEPNKFTGEDIREECEENYKRIIQNLLESPKQTIKASTSDIEIYKQWQHRKVEEHFNDNVERGIQAKMETYVWRLALVIEMMEQAVTGNFQPTLANESLKKAIRLVEYFRFNALKVHDKIMSKNPLEDLSAKQQELFKKLPVIFKRSDVLPLFEQNGFKPRTADRFLGKEKLFFNFRTSRELKVGEYTKKHKE